MEEINSNPVVARRLATAMSNGAEQMTQSGTTSLAERTTVQGNEKAKQSAEQSNQWVQQLTASLMKDIANIQSVATEFEVLDTKISDVFHPNIW